MPRTKPIPVTVLASYVISSVAPDLAAALNLKPHHSALAFFTTDCDDVGYVSLDEATKKASVDVVYASSFYAGAAHSSGPFSGEFIGMLAAANPADAQAGLQAAVDYARSEASFYRAGAPGRELAYFAHLVSRSGGYFLQEANIAEGASLAYLIAPPLEATAGLDAALKAAPVTMVRYFAPPTQTNFSGGWLSGSQAACQAACDAFAQMVHTIANQPLSQKV